MENAGIREDPTCFAPEARSVLVIGVNYPRSPAEPEPGFGRVAGFAAGEDYHHTMKRKLNELASFLGKFGVVKARIAVDSAPLLERALAGRAGLGWIGKNSCLISPRHGSWLLLGEMLVRNELEYDRPHPNRCGTCGRCLDACPTGALVAPGTVDANLCIAYWTVEAKGAIPKTMRPKMGSWIFGCDVCQQVCPWNRVAAQGLSGATDKVPALQAAELLEETEDSFKRRFGKSAFMRAGRNGMARNAAIVIGNSPPSRRGLEALRLGLKDAVPLVRGHAAWALGRFREFEALKDAGLLEKDPGVREEIKAAIGSAGA